MFCCFFFWWVGGFGLIFMGNRFVFGYFSGRGGEVEFLLFYFWGWIVWYFDRYSGICLLNWKLKDGGGLNLLNWCGSDMFYVEGGGSGSDIGCEI